MLREITARSVRSIASEAEDRRHEKRQLRLCRASSTSWASSASQEKLRKGDGRYSETRAVFCPFRHGRFFSPQVATTISSCLLDSFIRLLTLDSGPETLDPELLGQVPLPSCARCTVSLRDARTGSACARTSRRRTWKRKGKETPVLASLVQFCFAGKTNKTKALTEVMLRKVPGEGAYIKEKRRSGQLDCYS